MKRNAPYAPIRRCGYFAEHSGFTLVELLVVIALVGMILTLAVPTTRDAMTVNNLKKASRQFIGLARELQADAVRNQLDHILVLNIPGASYYIVTADMTSEKEEDIKKNGKKLPSGVAILDMINPRNEKVADGEVRIKFGKNNVGPPLVLHLAEEEDRMTLVLNPFLGITAVYDRYVDVSVDDGLGRNAAK